MVCLEKEKAEGVADEFWGSVKDNIIMQTPLYVSTGELLGRS